MPKTRAKKNTRRGVRQPPQRTRRRAAAKKTKSRGGSRGATTRGQAAKAAKSARQAEKDVLLRMNTRISHIMSGPAEEVILILEALDFEGLQKLQEQVAAVVMGHSQKSPEVARRLFQRRMHHLTSLQPWPAPGPLTAEQFAWLGSAGVRTKVHLAKKPIALSAKERASTAALLVATLDNTIVWRVNGDARLVVNANGEFWLAPVGTPIPDKVLVPTAFGQLQEKLPFPILVYNPTVGDHPEDEEQQQQGEQQQGEQQQGEFDLPDLPDDGFDDDEDAEDDGTFQLIHRVGGPAVRDSEGFELWARRGLPHRVDGPAVVRRRRTPDGRQQQQQQYFFRGRPVANQAALTAAAAAAAPDPVFDDVQEKSPPHMVMPAEWLAALASAAPQPHRLPPIALTEPPFVPNNTLDRLLRSRMLVRTIEFPRNHVLHLDHAKPLGDVVRDDLVHFFSQPITESYVSATFRSEDDDDLEWAYFPSQSLFGGIRVTFDYGVVPVRRLVAVEMVNDGAVRLLVANNPNVPEAEWTIPEQ